MDSTTVEAFDYHHYSGSLGFIPLIVILAVLIVPNWKLWSRTGHSGAWALLMLVPPANIISLWALASKEWPVLRGRGGN